MVCWSLSYVVKLYCFIAAEHGRYGSMEDSGVSNAEYLVHLVHMNRLHACRVLWGVYTVNLNGTRCRDGVKVFWCHSHLVWLGSIPTCACFHSENLFVTCSCCSFVLLFRNGKREEVRREAKGKMHGL